MFIRYVTFTPASFAHTNQHLRFSAPIQRDLTMYSSKPSRFGELLKKMVMALYIFKILSICGCLHDDATDKFKLRLQQWVTIAFGGSLRTYDSAPFC